MPHETSLPQELQTYGALESQLIDLTRTDEPRILGYLDLRSGSADWEPPTVVENHGRPCVHVFDSRTGINPERIGYWCRRIALRGDGAWVGVLEPGRLRVFRTDVKGDAIAPVEVATAQPGESALARFLHDVSSGQDDIARRRYLTKLLHGSARSAMAQGLSELDALSLVGRGLFWRFLVDRKLLAGLKPDEICSTATAWEYCLDNKTRALRTFRWLDETFNGGLLPFEANPTTFPPSVFASTLGNIAHGATETGQLRLPSDWREVNFAHIPVGLLSEVYQAFAHSIDAKAAAEKSIYYTPSHLAEFIVAQALEQLANSCHPIVLDPAAGGGVFLVVALRKLVEREWYLTSSRPRRGRIREILNRQLTGFDIDGRALRLAELALYLTALELDPSPQPVKSLRFETLRGRVLFDLSRAPHGSLGAVDPQFKHRFDIVIGNPPWTAKAHGRSEKDSWVRNSLGIVRDRLGQQAVAHFDLPDTNTDLPFVWRALEWSKPSGRIALVTHARWLFGQSDRARRARNDLFQATRVTGILNGAALRLTHVWPGVNAPWCVLFATNESPSSLDKTDYAFQFISLPLDAGRDTEQTRIRLDWFDAHTVVAQELLDRPWTLKTRFRGNRLAERVLESLKRSGVDLTKYLQQLGGIAFRNGYQVGREARKQKQQSARHMIGMPDTKNAGPLAFMIDIDSLPRFVLKKLLRPRKPSIYRAPLLLLAKSISSDRLAVRASRSDSDLAYDATYYGVSFAGISDSDRILRYLQLWLQSSVVTFCALMLDAQHGMERDGIYQESLGLMPIIPFDRLRKSTQERMAQLSRKITGALDSELAEEIDEFVFDTFDLSIADRQAIRDTLDTSSPSTAAKRNAARAPTPLERQKFVSTLQASLTAVLSASNLTAEVRECSNPPAWPWRWLDVCISGDGRWTDCQVPIDHFLTEADEGGASLVIVQANDSQWRVGLIDRYRWWTITRARLLATDLVAQCSPE